MAEAEDPGAVLQRGKGWEMSQGDVLVGVHKGRVMLQAAARGQWGKFVGSVT